MITIHLNRILLLACTLSISAVSFAQRTLRQRTDSITALVQQFLNEKQSEKLYELTAPSFREQLNADQFKTVTEKGIYPMGKIVASSFEKTTNGIFFYKVDFASGPSLLSVGIDKNDRIFYLLLGPYQPSVKRDPKDIATSNPLKTDLDKKVNELALNYMTQANTSGMIIGILDRNQQYFYGYGETNKKTHAIPDASTISEIGSISKTFTATILAHAIHEGKLKLDDPVNKYLPDSIPLLQLNGKAVTFRHLMNHTAGFPRMPEKFDEKKIDQNGIIIYPVEQFFGFLKNLKLLNEPGVKSEYSNAGVSLVSTILQRLYNKTYEQLIWKYICDPLGMKDTRIHIRKEDSARFATGYDASGEYYFPRNLPPVYQGAGGLRSTATDLLKYAKAQWDAPSRSLTKDIALTHDTTFTMEKSAIGIAWMHVFAGDVPVLFHNGATGGYRSYLAVNLEKKIAVVVLVNSAIAADKTGADLIQWLSKQ
ncbi:beta-lactamase family protein [Pseudoflavitalea sp. G-6-1-2]|uniref:serine hydrolase domain-containing protein n=1 Tax=Pseudoflavitalea sp. G-6-1-2 TaxID=2728841 RepID=UPI00146CF5BD|nr:serine hydrolase domain-containing protein [Pseudoflavitalea sp. G-6-1-2]NML19550.1 beta-lactamase family protein [Pseudoflavitalea sp. G-6-1-2]